MVTSTCLTGLAFDPVRSHFLYSVPACRFIRPRVFPSSSSCSSFDPDGWTPPVIPCVVPCLYRSDVLLMFSGVRRRPVLAARPFFILDLLVAPCREMAHVPSWVHLISVVHNWVPHLAQPRHTAFGHVSSVAVRLQCVLCS